MEYARLKKVFITSLLSGSIMLSTGTVAANSREYRNARFYAQYNIELLQDDLKVNQDKIIKPKRHKSTEKFSNAINSLVERKVITKDKAEEIKIYLKKHKEERKEFHDKIKSMTEKERKEYFKNNKKERKDIIEKMIEDGVITEEQGTELRKALKECKQ